MTVCACSPEGQLCPELHQEKCDQQVQGGDSAPLLLSRETPPGVLHTVLAPQHKKDMELLKQVQQLLVHHLLHIHKYICIIIIFLFSILITKFISTHEFYFFFLNLSPIPLGRGWCEWKNCGD